MSTSNVIDHYIASQDKLVQPLLRQMHAAIIKAAPEAREKISYGMPTYDLHGNLVHFAAYNQHIGFYPTPSAVRQFSADIANYKFAKGSVQFPLDEPLPLDLITRMVKFRVRENQEKYSTKLAAASRKKT